jgi:Werner syndrome ATP-dependent helicase
MDSDNQSIRFKHYSKVAGDYFNIHSLKPEQLEIIDSVLYTKRDVLGVLATGFGKSMCFQLPYLLSGKNILVISPLIALMMDQKNILDRLGIPCICLNGSNNNKSDDIRDINMGNNKIIFITPETCVLMDCFIKSLEDKLALICVDEAHCLSSWGQDFRKSYLELGILKNWLPKVPILAITATAGRKVSDDIIRFLKMENPQKIVGSFYRSNLDIHVKPRNKDTKREIISLIKTKYPNDYVIIYCKTKEDTEKIAEELNSNSIKCVPYHGGMSISNRNTNQSDFMDGSVKCIVATIAFGMGINIPNIRCVIHYACPKNIESYYQEIGRAGRDSLNSTCYLYYSAKDFIVNRLFIKDLYDGQFKKYMTEQLQDIEKYVFNITDCRWNQILRNMSTIVDKSLETFINCGHCDNCQSTRPEKRGDFTEHSHWIFETVKILDQSFGASMIVNILRGSKAKTLRPNHKYCDTYNIGSCYSEKYWKALIRMLVQGGYLRERAISGGYGNVIELTSISYTTNTIELDLTVDMISELPKPLVRAIPKPLVEQENKTILSAEEEIVIPNPVIKKTKKTSTKSDNNISETVMTSYNLYKDGKTIKEIAIERNLSPTTIETHLVKCYECKYELIQDHGYDTDVYDKVFKIISNIVDFNIDKPELKKIKDLLDDVSYFQIKLALVDYKNKVTG